MLLRVSELKGVWSKPTSAIDWDWKKSATITESRGLLGLLDGRTCGKRPFWLSRLANFFQGTVGACGDAEKVSLASTKIGSFNQRCLQFKRVCLQREGSCHSQHVPAWWWWLPAEEPGHSALAWHVPINSNHSFSQRIHPKFERTRGIPNTRIQKLTWQLIQIFLEILGCVSRKVKQWLTKNMPQKELLENKDTMLLFHNSEI